jgi:hypothetical protein
MLSRSPSDLYRNHPTTRPVKTLCANACEKNDM